MKLTTKNRGEKFIEDFLISNPVASPSKRPTKSKELLQKQRASVDESSDVDAAAKIELNLQSSSKGPLIKSKLNIAKRSSRDPRLRAPIDSTRSQIDPLTSLTQSLRASILKRVLKWQFNWIEVSALLFQVVCLKLDIEAFLSNFVWFFAAGRVD